MATGVPRLREDALTHGCGAAGDALVGLQPSHSRLPPLEMLGGAQAEANLVLEQSVRPWEVSAPAQAPLRLEASRSVPAWQPAATVRMALPTCIPSAAISERAISTLQ